MPTLTEGKHTGEFIGEYTMGIGYHVDNRTILSGQNLTPCVVVGTVTASSKDKILAPASVNGDQIASGIMFEGANATAGDVIGQVVRRGPMFVNRNDLVWPVGISAPNLATAIAQLLALGIKVV